MGHIFKYFFRSRMYVGIAVAWLGVACSGGEKTFTIEGTLEGTGSVQTVVLQEGDRKLDSVFLAENGRFRLRRTATQPRLFTLVVGTNRFPVILQNGDHLTFRADLAKGDGSYTVSGSDLTETIQGFAAIQREREQFERQLDADFAALADKLDEQAIMAMRDEFMGKYRQFMRDYTQQTVVFAEANDNLAGFYAMSTLDPEWAESELIAYADRIGNRYDDNAVVRGFLDDVAQLRRLAVGQPAPYFESLTAHNRTVKLTDFQGSYTLVDFWASWCVPCREENPNILRQYERFRDKGFTVLGVSLDGNPGSWLRAVEEDQLAWTNVSDLQAWQSPVIELYGIKAIPTSYLLDPNGVILAKNLRGPDLELFLTELLD